MEPEHQKNPGSINTSKKIYNKFGKYYDTLYDRFIDYKLDCDFFEKLFKRHYKSSTNVLKILDLGCGTGNHAIEFARRGYEVTAVDISNTCIESAQRKLSFNKDLEGIVNFKQEDLRFIDYNHEFDLIMAIFGVISYIPEPENLENIFSRIRRSIKPGGLFIGEFWHKPGVPDEFEFTTRSGKSSENLELNRTAKGKRLEGTNTIKVDMEFTLKNAKTGEDLEHFTEIHHLRSFDLNEFEALLNSSSFKMLDFTDADGKNYEYQPVKPKTFAVFFISEAV
jgi:SAM-dependent methyltransferase